MLRRMFLLFVIALGLLGLFDERRASAGESAEPRELVEQGNQSYQQANYLAAAHDYRQAIAHGANNGHVYFNLGNTYYRLEQWGRAIAAYREALLELPGDPDVRANLQLARKQTKDRIGEGAQSIRSVSKQLLVHYPHLNRSQMETVFLFFYVAGWLGMSLAALFQLPRASTFGYICFTVACVWGVLTFGVARDRDGEPRFAFGATRHETPAVIVASEAKLYSGDSESYQVVFLLHDGAEVLTREHRPGWIEVLLPDGRRGWAKADDLQLVS